MKYCKKCNHEINDNAKFCTSCGEMVNTNEINNRIKEPVESKIRSSGKKSYKVLVSSIIAIMIVVIAGVAIFMKLNSNSKDTVQGNITIESVDLADYPEIKISITAENHDKNLLVNNFTLKEGDRFQKGLELTSTGDGGKYIIAYKTSNKDAAKAVDISLAYLEDGKELISTYSYTAPEKTKETVVSTTNNSGTNVVDTYDSNEIDIKDFMDNYQIAFVQMVRYKDTYYIRDLVDLSGNLMDEYTNTMKSYLEQDINEEIIDHKIELVNKVSDTQYEVTTYEKYYIDYGKENKEMYIDFRTIYVLNKTNLGFKIYSIKKTEKVNSKLAS